MVLQQSIDIWGASGHPPLQEFPPHADEEMAEVAASVNLLPGKVQRRAQVFHEHNPMLGFRGVQLAIAHIEIAETQAGAISEVGVEADRSPACSSEPRSWCCW